MKKILNFLLFTAIIVSMTACFDITEEVTVNKNGSGNYISIIDATKLSEQMQMIASFDTTGQMIPKLKYSLDSTFEETFNKYKTVKDVSKVLIDSSKPYVYKVSLDFANIEALNSVLALDKKEDAVKNLYSWEKGKLTRKDLALNLDEMKMEDEQQKEMAKSMLEGMKYRVILNLPNKVTKASNKEAKISSDGKTVTLECSLLDVMNKKVNLGNEIIYKK